MDSPAATPSASRWDAVSYAVVVRGLSALGILILLGPIVIVVTISFTDALALRFPPPGYSMRWYLALFDAEKSAEIQRAALNSLIVATCSTAIATTLGTLAALAIARRAWSWAGRLDLIFMSPLVLPSLAIGLAMLMYFTLVGLRPSMPVLIAGHVVMIVPFVLRTTIANLSQLNPVLLESSESLGASRFFTFRRLTLPLIMPGVGAGTFLAFMASFDNIPVSLFLTDARTEMLPIRMWGMLETRLDVRVAAISGLVSMATLLLLVIVDRLVRVDRQLR
jgi:putative spermidine/putrescine transport system permease protein